MSLGEFGPATPWAETKNERRALSKRKKTLSLHPHSPSSYEGVGVVVRIMVRVEELPRRISLFFFPPPEIEP